MLCKLVWRFYRNNQKLAETNNIRIGAAQVDNEIKRRYLEKTMLSGFPKGETEFVAFCDFCSKKLGKIPVASFQELLLNYSMINSRKAAKWSNQLLVNR